LIKTRLRPLLELCKNQRARALSRLALIALTGACAIGCSPKEAPKPTNSVQWSRTSPRLDKAPQHRGRILVAGNYTLAPGFQVQEAFMELTPKGKPTERVKVLTLPNEQLPNKGGFQRMSKEPLPSGVPHRVRVVMKFKGPDGREETLSTSEKTVTAP
jgi:hypothetical protein